MLMLMRTTFYVCNIRCSHKYFLFIYLFISIHNIKSNIKSFPLAKKRKYYQRRKDYFVVRYIQVITTLHKIYSVPNVPSYLLFFYIKFQNSLSVSSHLSFCVTFSWMGSSCTQAGIEIRLNRSKDPTTAQHNLEPPPFLKMKQKFGFLPITYKP